MFTISGNGITPCIGGATTTYNGTLNDNIISGSFSGYGQCCYKDPDGNLLCDIPTWTGTFTVSIRKLERCFGGIGVQCQGFPIPFFEDWDTCLVNGWMSAGSILHDRCCVETSNTGVMCANPNGSKACGKYWDLAVGDYYCGRFWMHTFGPYPAGNTGDDTTKYLRAPAGAPIHPQYEYLCAQSGKCQVNAKGRTIIIQKGFCKYCVCQ
jgi:hypothetical protein